MNIEKIMNAIYEAHKNGFTHFGVRGDNVDIEVGQSLENSYDWDYENDCQSTEKLPGTCTTGFGYLWFDGDDEDRENIETAISYNMENYRYTHVSVIAGTYADGRFEKDPNELLIADEQVIYVIK